MNDKSRHQKDLLTFEYTIIIVTPSKLLSHQILLPQLPREKIGAEAHQNIAARANQKKIAVESHQNLDLT